MAKQRIRLTEADLHRVIKESVKNILVENSFDDFNEKHREFYHIIENACELWEDLWYEDIRNNESDYAIEVNKLLRTIESFVGKHVYPEGREAVGLF